MAFSIFSWCVGICASCVRQSVASMYATPVQGRRCLQPDAAAFLFYRTVVPLLACVAFFLLLLHAAAAELCSFTDFGDTLSSGSGGRGISKGVGLGWLGVSALSAQSVMPRLRLEANLRLPKRGGPPIAVCVCAHKL